MLALAHYYLFVFGAVTVLGGVIGFVKAQSKASLVAGGVAGGLLVLAGSLVATNGRVGLVLGLVVSLALAGRFVMAFRKSKKLMPAGLMALLSVVAGVILALALASGAP